MGAGARSVYHIIKSKTIVGSERTVRKILGRRVDHSFANARFTNQAPITSIVAKKVFERVQIDLVDMRKDRVLYNGVRYSFILSVVDCFSRFTFLRPLPSKRSSGILHCLKNIFHEHGYPSIVQCDNGMEFKGKLPSFLSRRNVKLINSRPYHPQSQGKVERNNATLKKRLRYRVAKKKTGDNWVNNLRKVSSAMNNTPKECLGYQSPFSVYYARDRRPDRCRKKAAEYSARCATREKSYKDGSSCSIYQKGEKVLIKYPLRSRVPRKRAVIVGKILKRNKTFSKYYVAYIDPDGKRQQSWVSVESITSLTMEQEKIRKKESKRIFQDMRKKENHRTKYYIPVQTDTEGR